MANGDKDRNAPTISCLNMSRSRTQDRNINSAGIDERRCSHGCAMAHKMIWTNHSLNTISKQISMKRPTTLSDFRTPTPENELQRCARTENINQRKLSHHSHERTRHAKNAKTAHQSARQYANCHKKRITTRTELPQEANCHKKRIAIRSELP
jgi:hypothetical protein